MDVYHQLGLCYRLVGLSSLPSSMRGRQQLSCPVLRPPSGPNARPQDNIPLHKGNNENSLELIPIKEVITSYNHV